MHETKVAGQPVDHGSPRQDHYDLTKELTRSEAQSIWNSEAGKRERYGLEAMIIHRVSVLFLAKARQDQSVHFKSYFEVANYLADGLSKAVDEVVASLSSPTDVDHPYLNRLKHIVEFSNEKKVFEKGYTLEELIVSGIQTNVRFMKSVIVSLPTVYKRKFPDKKMLRAELRSIAENSFPLLAYLAARSNHLIPYMGLMNTLKAKHLDLVPAKGQNGELMLALKQGETDQNLQQDDFITRALQGDLASYGALVEGGVVDEQSCPALKVVNGQIAIKEIWKWFIESSTPFLGEE